MQGIQGTGSKQKGQTVNTTDRTTALSCVITLWPVMYTLANSYSLNAKALSKPEFNGSLSKGNDWVDFGSHTCLTLSGFDV